MADIVKGNEIALGMKTAVREKILRVRPGSEMPPKLVSVSVGRSGDAEIYVNMQRKAADFTGIEFSTLELEPSISQRELAGQIEKLNADRTVSAIIVQKPLPGGIDHSAVAASIAPDKDAEGIHPLNLGRIFRRQADIVPCTPGAVMKILSERGVDLYGREVVIIGHSAIVGKPLSMMMLNEMATTTVCHIGTHEKGDLISHIGKADVLVVAVGKAEMVKGAWIKPGAVVVDVGINKVAGGVVGDVEFDEAAEKASLITPVPGGVGPVTVSVLMRNVLRAYLKNVARK